MIAAFALDRLDEDGRHLVRRRDALEHRLLDLLDAGAAGDRVVALLAAARERHVMNVRHQRREAAAMDQLRAGQRHGPVGAAVKGAEEGDGPRPPGVPAGQLQGRFERFGPAVGEEDPLRRCARRDLGQPLGQVDLRLVVEIGARHVQQLGRLVLNGGDDLRMTMPRRGDGDAGGEVEKQIAVHVLDDRPAAPGAHQRIDARVRRRHVLLVALQQGLGVTTRQRGLDGRDGAFVELPHGFFSPCRVKRNSFTICRQTALRLAAPQRNSP